MCINFFIFCIELCVGEDLIQFWFDIFEQSTLFSFYITYKNLCLILIAYIFYKKTRDTIFRRLAKEYTKDIK